MKKNYKDFQNYVRNQLEEKRDQDDKRYDNFKLSFDRKIEELKQWMCKMTEVINLSCLLDQQDELDKQSLSLVGQKKGDERHHSPESGGGKLSKDLTVSLDPKCLNCQGNNVVEKRIILEQFKIACLQYKPSKIMVDAMRSIYKSRQEVIDDRNKIIRDMEMILPQDSIQNYTNEVAYLNSLQLQLSVL